MNEAILQQLQEESNKKPRQERPNWDLIVKILKFYETGSYSYNTLSRVLKISPQRVGQIVKKYSYLMDKKPEVQV